MMTEEQIQRTAGSLARELVEREVDHNEVAKVLAYLRSDPAARHGAYLELLVNRGQDLIRSNRTMGYYRDLKQALARHLDPEVPRDELLQVLGATVRLMRYFRLNPESRCDGWLQDTTRPASSPRGQRHEEVYRRIPSPRPGPRTPSKRPPEPPARSAPASPPQGPKKGDKCMVQVKEFQGGIVRAEHASGWTCEFDRPLLGLKVGDRVEVEITGSPGPVHKARFRKKK